MANITEASLGNRLRQAQDLLQYIQKFPNYSPPRVEEQVEQFGDLLQQITTTNSQVALNKDIYSLAVDRRVQAFKGSENSLMKLVTKIRGAVEAQYGKQSKAFQLINNQVKVIRNTKVAKPPQNPDNEKESGTVSRSQRSYGSLTQAFRNLVQILQSLPDYNPSNPILKIEELQKFSNQLNALNDEVAEKVHTLKAARSVRNLLYGQLKERVKRIKAYIKAQYGMQSKEYELVRGLRV